MLSKVLMVFLVGFILGTNAWSLRVPFPPTLRSPIEEDQVASLNKYLKDLWDMQSGRFELDVVTTTKSNAKNGEIWIYNNAGTYSLQVKAGGVVRSTALTP
jgi:hypothetical protein